MDNKYNYAPGNKGYMIIIAALILLLFLFGHLITGFISLFMYAALIIYNIRNIKIKKVEWKRFIEDFSLKLDSATRNTLIKSPFPLIIISSKGNVLWYNQNSTQLIESEDILGKNVNEFVKGINVRQALDEKKNIFDKVQVKDKYYKVYTSNIRSEDDGIRDEIILLYFYDITEMVQIQNAIEDNKETMMLIEVDNLDEVTKTMLEDKRPLLIAEIERAVNGYGQSLNAMLKKYSSNKYVLIAQDKYIQKEMDKKFDILDTVREINEGNQMSVTLSIGVGRGGDTPLDNYNLALSAKELSLGRGGDQVVVKSKDKLSFYGGKTKEVEKRTKVRARVIAQALSDLIKESSKIYIMGHRNMDIDCIGAAVGINSVVRMLGKECNIIIDEQSSGIKQILKWFREDSDYDKIFINNDEAKNAIEEDALIILVDVHNKGYVQDMELVNDFSRLVIIDHHRKAKDFIEGALISYIEPYASSTSELVTEMIQYMIENPRLKPIEAEALLAGICIDTKNFYFKTGVRTFEAAAFLRKLGADTVNIKKVFGDDLDTYIKRSEIMKSAKIVNNIAIAICPPGMGDNVLAAQAADELLNITGIQASFVLVKIEEDIIISGRSLNKVNVQLILESLGGGGHMNIAGAKLEHTTYEEAEKRLREAIDKYLREGEIK